MNAHQLEYGGSGKWAGAGSSGPSGNFENNTKRIRIDHRSEVEEKQQNTEGWGGKLGCRGEKAVIRVGECWVKTGGDNAAVVEAKI